MTDNLLQETAAALRQDWELQLSGTLSEEALLQLLADKIVQVLERGAEPFFQLMYRLDIPERKLNDVMLGENAAMEIARLVYQRQLQKIKSRQANKGHNTVDDPELGW